MTLADLIWFMRKVLTVFFLLNLLFLFLSCLAQMEEVIARMQDEKNGIPIRTVKSFLTKIPSVFSGKLLLMSEFFCPLLSVYPKKKGKTVKQ